MSKRISDNYGDTSNLKDDLYAEIEARRKEREGKEGFNQFDGITSTTLKADLVKALDDDDKLPGVAGRTATGGLDQGTAADVPSKAELKERQEMVDKTNPHKTANENVEAGGHATGKVPGGYT